MKRSQGRINLPLIGRSEEYVSKYKSETTRIYQHLMYPYKENTILLLFKEIPRKSPLGFLISTFWTWCRKCPHGDPLWLATVSWCVSMENQKMPCRSMKSTFYQKCITVPHSGPQMCISWEKKPPYPGLAGALVNFFFAKGSFSNW